MPSDSLNDVIEAVPELSAPSTTKFDPLRSWFSRELGLSEDEIYAAYVSKAGNLKVRLGQSGNAARPLGVAVNGPDIGDVEYERTLEAARKLVGDEDYPAVIAFCGTAKGVPWTVSHVVAAGRSDVVKKLSASFPDAHVEQLHPSATSSQSAPADVNDLARSLFVDVEWLREVLALLEDKKALILYGPPGTGKTYLARAISRFVTPDPKLRTLVQLHPSFGYEDFFEGYRPTPSGSGLHLTKTPGPLRRLVNEAVDQPDAKAVMLIDEINRGNLPRVFGELYFLIEYRMERVSLMYSPEEEFTLPQNLNFIGTMNTADRSVAILDQALRRRFHFVGLFPGEPPVAGMLRGFLQQYVPKLGWLADLLDRANSRLDRHVQIGPSHFMRRDIDEALARRLWKHAVLPSIAEQYFGRESELTSLDFESLKAELQAQK